MPLFHRWSSPQINLKFCKNCLFCVPCLNSLPQFGSSNSVGGLKPGEKESIREQPCSILPLRWELSWGLFTRVGTRPLSPLHSCMAKGHLHLLLMLFVNIKLTCRIYSPFPIRRVMQPESLMDLISRITWHFPTLCWSTRQNTKTYLRHLCPWGFYNLAVEMWGSQELLQCMTCLLKGLFKSGLICFQGGETHSKLLKFGCRTFL